MLASCFSLSILINNCGRTIMARSKKPMKTLKVDMTEVLEETKRVFWEGTKGETQAVLNAADSVNLLAEAGVTKVSDIDEDAVDELVAAWRDRGLADATINRKLSALSKMLDYALRKDWIDRKPHIERRKESKGRIRWLTDREEAKVLKWMEDQGERDVADLIAFLLDTGMRRSEALTLQWKDVKREQVHIWDTKNGEGRTVWLTNRAKDILKSRRKYKHNGPFTKMNKEAVRWVWDKMKADLGLENDSEFVLHALRHTFCTRLVQSGIPIYTVKKLAGHKRIETTERYAHLSDKETRAAIQVLNK